VAVGLEDGVADSVGVGEGEGLRFFFFVEGLGEESGVGAGDVFCFFGEGLGEESGVGAGEVFFFFGEAVAAGVSANVGLPEAFFFFEGDGDFSGVADGFGVGDFSASSFFFGVGELLRCFRGVGVGVGAKIFLILLPNVSSAGARCAMPGSIAIRKKMPAMLLIRRMGAGK
jgi:hypothetical protein